MINQKLKVSPHGNFQITQLCENVAICEAKEDRHNWGNATETEPAFIVYIGCKKNEVAEKINYINNALGCYWCEVRKPKYLKGFEAEIKIRGMKRESDNNAYGLDYLIWKENNYEYLEDEEIEYYSTRYMPRW